MLFVAKKSTFIKNKELNNNSNGSFKINKIANKFLLNGDKFLLKLHLKQLGFTYRACGTSTKTSLKNSKIQRNR